MTQVAFMAGAFNVDGDIGVEVQQCAPLEMTSAIDDVGSAPWVASDSVVSWCWGQRRRFECGVDLLLCVDFWG